jgi:preprotein translocase subunit SecY
MSLLRSHLVLMFIYALGTALFFTLLWKQGRRAQIRFCLLVFLSLFAGGIIVGWVMFPFPLQ